MFLSRGRFCRSRWQSLRLGALFWCLEFGVYKSYKVSSLELSSEAVGTNPGAVLGVRGWKSRFRRLQNTRMTTMIMALRADDGAGAQAVAASVVAADSFFC